jgi:hypothetical protein
VSRSWPYTRTTRSEVGWGRRAATRSRRRSGSRCGCRDSRDHGADGVDLLVVVAVRVEAQPQLAGVDIDDLIGEHGPSDVARHILDARHRTKFVRDLADDPVHLLGGCPGRRVEVDEDVRVAERRKRRAGGLGKDRGPEQDDSSDRGDGHECDDRSRAVDHAR